MSPAKRKRETAGRAPAAAKRAVSRKDRACGYEPDTLEAALEATDTRGEVLAHVPACEPCGDQLEVIAVQRDTLQFLGEGEAAESALADRPVVRRLLDATAAAGRKGLADLVYELAKACLFAADDFNVRLRRESEPRPFPSVRNDAARSMSRLKMPKASALPPREPGSSNLVLARRSARSCHRILVNVEGETARSGLLDGVLLLGEDKPAEAERGLRTLLGQPLSEVERRYALMNLTLAQIRQSDYRTAVASAQSAASEYPDEWAFLFNAAVGCCHLRDVAGVESAARLIREKLGCDADGRLRAVVHREAKNFSEVLGMSEVDVLRLFGADSVPRREGRLR